MIIGIPSSDEFGQAGLDLLYLAWDMAVGSVMGLEGAKSFFGDPRPEDENDHDAASQTFWQKKQPALGNAFTLIQQGIELALKGRIARTSPYLLLSVRDARDYPSGSDKINVEFSQFRTLDSADLLRIHNTHCVEVERFGDEFRDFFDAVRKRRNALMHSVNAAGPIHPKEIIKNVLTAYKFLYSDMRWPTRLLNKHEHDEYAGFHIGEYVNRPDVLNDISVAINCLEPRDCKYFLDFNKKQRTYVCPACYDEIYRKHREGTVQLAQLVRKARGATTLWCCVCDTITPVRREKCDSRHGCKGDVICDGGDWDGLCLTCEHTQGNHGDFSGSEIPTMLPFPSDQ